MEEPPVFITNIQKFAVNDGPGFRTAVFVKGCQMQCEWCHNPETLHPYQEIYYKSRNCVQCGACLEACSEDAIYPPISPEEAQAPESSYQKIKRDRCNRCMDCIEACHYKALEIVGKPLTIEQILDIVEQDKPFYDNSGGGLTLSGGEPTAFPEFSLNLLKSAKERELHTCLDTNGFCEWDVLKQLTEYTDIVLFDLKQIDPVKHQEKTGVSNQLILNNLEQLSKSPATVWIRIPVVPDYNDDIEFHKAAAAFLTNLPGKVDRLDLIPFHNYCQQEYAYLGLDWPLRDVMPIEPSFLEIPAEIYRNLGLKTTVGGSAFEGVENQVLV